MSPLEFSVVFAVGLAGGLHCLQMCGPIVLSYSVGLANGGAFRREMLLAHLFYNAGRIVTYMLLGALAGAAGGGIGLLAGMAGLASGARLFAGAAMVVTGFVMLRVLPRTGLVQVERRGVRSWFSRAVGRLLLSGGAPGKLVLGLVLGFLPCGLVYAALLKAIESATPLAGAATMLAFGLGTSVALLGMGLAGSLAGLRLGAWGTRVAALSLMAAGGILLWRGIHSLPVCHG
jgi:sulfite exporter TauE/SafE